MYDCWLGVLYDCVCVGLIVFVVCGFACFCGLYIVGLVICLLLGFVIVSVSVNSVDIVDLCTYCPPCGVLSTFGLVVCVWFNCVGWFVRWLLFSLYCCCVLL